MRLRDDMRWQEITHIFDGYTVDLVWEDPKTLEAVERTGTVVCRSRETFGYLQVTPVLMEQIPPYAHVIKLSKEK